MTDFAARRPASRFLPALALLLLLPCGSANAGTSMVSIFPEDETAREEASAARLETTPLYKVVSTSGGVRQRLRGLLPIEAYRDDALRLYHRPPTTLRGETDLGCTAVAVYHEARGESVRGQKAVASVVLQRALVPDRWGDRPCDVVRPVQFSFMTSRYGFPPIAGEEGWQKAWARAIDIAAQILAYGPLPELRQADHYHAREVHPTWRLEMVKTAVIGNHIFYADPDSQSGQFQ